MINIAKSMSLKEDRLPRDWELRFKPRLLQAFVDFLWEDWPSFHSGTIQQRSYAGTYWSPLNRYILSFKPPEEISLEEAYPYFNKTAVLYLAYGGDPDLHYTVNEPDFPDYWEYWLKDAYDEWARNCEPRERLDGRFVFKPQHFTPRDEKRLSAWIGLGMNASEPNAKDVEQLVDWHIQHCDLIKARAAAPVPDDIEYWMKGRCMLRTKGTLQLAKGYHSSLSPTCRAILAIARSPMTESRHVLLVLTGHNQDMVSGPPTFEGIPAKDIVARRSEAIVEVSLQTAVKYLQVLEKNEESVNTAFREKNNARREAIDEDLKRRAHNELEEICKDWGRTGGRRTRRGRKRTKRPMPLICLRGHSYGVWQLDLTWQVAWRYVVADEKQLAWLSSTTELRQMMQDEDDGV